jgi:hypothetical protein
MAFPILFQSLWRWMSLQEEFNHKEHKEHNEGVAAWYTVFFAARRRFFFLWEYSNVAGD